MLCIGPSEIRWLPGEFLSGFELLAAEVADLSKDKVDATPSNDGSEIAASEASADGKPWLKENEPQGVIGKGLDNFNSHSARVGVRVEVQDGLGQEQQQWLSDPTRMQQV